MRSARLSLIACALALPSLAPAQDIVLPDGKAKKIIENACTECHGLDTVVSNPMPATKWRGTVNSMVRRGATLEPEEIDAVVDYLTVYFSLEKVNVNTAGLQELQDGLQFTAGEAKAIFDYRKTNGNFKDLAGLKKVPGVDSKKLDEKKDSLIF
jgi:competence protein ComEA